MVYEGHRKCLKCGCSSSRDGVNLFRFRKPGVNNLIRCTLWAKYVLPDKESFSIELQNKLYSQHRMLCERHFQDTDFTDFTKKKLHRIACPADIQKAPGGHKSNLDNPGHEDHSYTGTSSLKLVTEDKDAGKCRLTDSSLSQDEKKKDLINCVPKEQENKEPRQNAANDMKMDQYEAIEILDDEIDDAFYAIKPEGPFSWQKDETTIPCVDDDEALVPPTTQTDEVDSQVEEWLRCNECQQLITGMRFVCLECADCELCPQCEEKGSHAAHYVLRAPQGALKRSVQAIVVAARRALAETQILLNEDTEIKSETEEPSEAEDPFSFSAPQSRLSDVADTSTTNPLQEEYLEQDSDDDVSYVPESHSDDSDDTQHSEHEHRKRRKCKYKEADEKDGHTKEDSEHEIKRQKLIITCEDKSKKLIHLAIKSQKNKIILVTNKEHPKNRNCYSRKNVYSENKAVADNTVIDNVNVSNKRSETNASDVQWNSSYLNPTSILMQNKNTNSQIEISNRTVTTGCNKTENKICYTRKNVYSENEAVPKNTVIDNVNVSNKRSETNASDVQWSSSYLNPTSIQMQNTNSQIEISNSTVTKGCNKTGKVPLKKCIIRWKDCFGQPPLRVSTIVPASATQTGSFNNSEGNVSKVSDCYVKLSDCFGNMLQHENSFKVNVPDKNLSVDSES